MDVKPALAAREHGRATGFSRGSATLPPPAGYRSKLEIPRDRLTDQDFDQIVVATSASVTDRARQLMRSLGLNLLAHELEQTSGVLSDGLAANSQSCTILSQPKRPMNAFMVWGQAIRRELHNMYSNVQNALLSKALGRVWKRLDLQEKEPYINKANVIKRNHKRDYPNYRYQPRRIQEKPRPLVKKSKSTKCRGLAQPTPTTTASAVSITTTAAVPAASATTATTTAILSSSQVNNVIRTYSKASSHYNEKPQASLRSSHQTFAGLTDQYTTTRPGSTMTATTNCNAYADHHQSEQHVHGHQWSPVNMVHYPNGLHVLDCGRKSSSTSTGSTYAISTSSTTCNSNNITQEAKYSHYHDDLNAEYQLPPPIEPNTNSSTTNSDNLATNPNLALIEGYQSRSFYEQPRQPVEQNNQNQQYAFANLCHLSSPPPVQQINNMHDLHHHQTHQPPQTNNNDYCPSYRQQQQIDLGINQPSRYSQYGEQVQYLEANSRYNYNDYDQYHHAGCLP